MTVPLSMSTTSSKMSFSDKFRTWKNDDTTSSSPYDNQNQKPNNPFSRQDRRDKYSAAASAYSYAEHKRKKEEEAKEKEKNRPLTADDFPALGGNATVAVKAKGDPNRSSLAAHLAAAIKKDEEDAVRRRIQREEEEEIKRKEEGFVRLPLYGSVEAYFKAKRAEAARAEAAGEVPKPLWNAPPPVTLPPLKKKFVRPSMFNEDNGEYQDDYVEDFYPIDESPEEEEDDYQQNEVEMR